ncbi:hypothetical protein ACI1US_02519 [Leucobacter sp. BZR 635]
MSDNTPIPLRPEGQTERPERPASAEFAEKQPAAEHRERPAHPELPRAKTAARIVGLYIPLGLVVVEVIVFLAWLPRLPDEIAVHWSGAGVADGFASPILTIVMFPLVGLLMASLFFVTKAADLQAKLSPSRGGDVWGPMNRFLPAVVLCAAVSIFTLGIYTTWLQLDLADGRDLAPNLWAMVVPWPVGIAAGVLGYFAQPKLRVSAEVDADAGTPLEIAATERVAWLGSIGVTKPYLWTMITALVVGAAGFIFVLSLRSSSPVLVACMGAAFGLVLVLSVLSLRFNVRIDERGFEARSFVGWPVLRAAADNVADVSVGEINPLAEFGGWGLRVTVDGRVGIVMRTGEGLRIERRKGRDLVVTLDDAESAAAALATAAKLAQTASPQQASGSAAGGNA